MESLFIGKEEDDTKQWVSELDLDQVMEFLPNKGMGHSIRLN